MTTTPEFIAEPVRVVVAGAGQIACQHYIPALRAASEVLVVGLWEQNAEVAAEVADGLPEVRLPCKGETFGEYLLGTGADLLVNLTPPTQHYELTRAALERDINVFSEKPLSLGAGRAEELMTLAADRGVWLLVAPYVTGNPLLDAVCGVLGRGELGNLHTAFLRYGCSSKLAEGSSGWRADAREGGVLVDVGSYPLAILDRLFGPPNAVVSSARSAMRLPTGTFMESWSVGLSYGPATHAIVQTGTHYAASGFQLELRLTGTAGELKIVNGNLMSLEYDIASADGAWRTIRLSPTDYHWARGLFRHYRHSALQI